MIYMNTGIDHLKKQLLLNWGVVGWIYRWLKILIYIYGCNGVYKLWKMCKVSNLHMNSMTGYNPLFKQGPWLALECIINSLYISK